MGTKGSTTTMLPVMVLILLIGQQLLPVAANSTTMESVTNAHHGDVDKNPDNNSDEHGGESEAHSEHGGVHVASWNLHYVELPLAVTAFALLVGIAKVGFHQADFLSAFLPESVLLIVVGVLFGGISFATGYVGNYESQTFFLYLLPPIILEASYSLHDRTFLDNFGSILVYAVLGTLLNTFLIGLTLYGFSLTGAYGDTFTISLVQCLVFSSLISAVDPVAVLAIFQEIHVNQVLYFLVFGESLLNDAVTVVLYNMMNSFVTMETIPFSQIVLGFVSFFTVSLGGAVIGVIIGLATALLTRFTKHVRVVEPLALLGMAYLSYLVAELFHFSGIISIICCGLAQCQYAFANISRKSSTTVTYFTKMLSTTTESLIFFQLGQTLWAQKHEWNTGFVLLTLVFIFVYRAFGVMLLTFVVNKFRTIKINKEEQFVMSYGGLRGAVAFSLVATLTEEGVAVRNVLVTTTLVVIVFTVFIQGTTIKPLVKLFRIKRQAEEDEPSVTLGIHNNIMDYMMAGIEEIIGHKGRNYFRIWLEDLDNRFMKKYLQRRPETWEAQVMATFEEITNQDHHEHIFKLSKGECEDGEVSQPEMANFRPMLAKQASYFDSIRRTSSAKAATKGEYMAITDKTKSSDLKGIIRKNPGDVLHQKYDKNLLNDDRQDLPFLMRQRSEEHFLIKKRVIMSGAARWKKAFQDIKEAGMQFKDVKEKDPENKPRETGKVEEGVFGIAEEDAVITGVEDENPNDNMVQVDIEGGGVKDDAV